MILANSIGQINKKDRWAPWFTADWECQPQIMCAMMDPSIVYLNGWFRGRNIREAVLRALAGQ